MATYSTEIQWGGPEGQWHSDSDLRLDIINRKQIVDAPPAEGTQISWSGPMGNGTVTFFDGGSRFQGTAQFPNEGPVGYRGTLKS
ncbi:hypothetical protein ABT301_09480 [Streptomyces sp. NPDC000987]|uniref:hypothetical protein n=1 Tax=Streptomyces sp. NPDC000987 TaxID=3154374 RepID=UPI00331B7EA9